MNGDRVSISLSSARGSASAVISTLGGGFRRSSINSPSCWRIEANGERRTIILSNAVGSASAVISTLGGGLRRSPINSVSCRWIETIGNRPTIILSNAVGSITAVISIFEGGFLNSSHSSSSCLRSDDNQISLPTSRYVGNPSRLAFGGLMVPFCAVKFSVLFIALDNAGTSYPRLVYR